MDGFDNEVDKIYNKLENLNRKIDNLTENIVSVKQKMDKIYNKIDKDLTKECKKMGEHIDFIENVYENVKHPLGYMCNKITSFSSSTQQYSLTSTEEETCAPNNTPHDSPLHSPVENNDNLTIEEQTI